MVWSEPDLVSARPPALVGHTGTHVSRRASSDDLAETDYVYVLGGFSFSVESGEAESSSWHNDLWVLNTKELTWEHASFSGSPMSPRHGHTATLVGNRIYVFGGYTESGMAENTVLALKVVPDEATGKYKWETVHVEGNKPPSRQGHVAGLLASRYLAIFGGYQGEGGQSLTDVHVLDVSPPEEDGAGFSWSVPIVRGGDNKPSPREDMAGTVLPGRTELAIMGGCTYPSGSCYNDVHVLAVEGGEWSWLPTRVVSGEAPQAREEHSAVMVPREDVDSRESEVLIFGGGLRDTETYADLRKLVLKARNTTCPEGCSGHGTCDLGSCDCDDGFFGPICAKYCVDDCSGHGTCNRGECECEKGWLGDACAEPACPKNCSGHGACDHKTRECRCKAAWFGAACNRTCSPACGEHGKCTKELKCECEEGFRGEACTERVECPGGCSGHGSCDHSTGDCTCAEGFRGAACSKRTCPNGCSDHGTCGDDGECTCEEGWDGEDCATHKEHQPRQCPKQCSGHGTCDQETLNCTCVEEHGRIYYGADCAEWTYRTVRLNMTVGPCTPKGYLTVPAHNRNYTLVMVETKNEDGVVEEVPCPVPDAEEVELTATYSYTPEGSLDPVEEVVPLRRVGSKLVMTPPDAKKGKVETSALKGAEEAPVPQTLEQDVKEGTILVLSPGTDNEELARVKAVRAAVGAEARFRTATTLEASAAAAADDGSTEVSFTAPLEKSHTAPYEMAVSQTAPPPQPLPEVDPPKPEPECDSCNTEGGVCVFEDPDAAEPVSVCDCFPGYSGAACDVVTCPKNCTSADFGKCVSDGEDGWKCKCNFGYSGEDCAQFEGCGDLGRHCGEHGTCELVNRTMSKGGVSKTHTFGMCRCHRGWRGPLCDVEVCPRNCTADVESPERPHGRCVTEDRATFCKCTLGWTGDACDEPDPCPRDCSGHGACSSEDPNEPGRHCICREGWDGSYCQTPVPIPGDVCPLNCSNHGACHDGKCACHRGWSGTACNEPIPCPRNCSNHGTCNLGVCECALGWSGHDCSVQKRCPNACSRRGRCVLGECVCAIGWTGEDCSVEMACPEDCSGHGKCHNGRCECDVDWSGDDCSVDHGVHCQPEDCSGHGRCHFGTCYCAPGYAGKGCEEGAKCPVGPTKEGDRNETCRGNGVCRFGKCFCAPGYEGEDCHDAKECPIGHGNVVCSGHGYCDGAKGECFCAPGYDGYACERGAACPANCSSNGFCFNGKCECDVGFSGDDCSTPVQCPGVTEDAPGGCHGNGRCLRGKCYCAPGFTGADCANETVCPDSCSEHGRCTSGVCMCDPGFEGESCAEPVACKDECHHRGTCVLGSCICHSGYAGPACELHMPCPQDCNGHGDCMQGECICDGGYAGIDCGEGNGLGHECPNNCSGHGACRDGDCSCEPGWVGRSCRREVPCPMNCSGHGVCAHGDCFCDPGFQGRSCHLAVPCPEDCSGHGDCAHGKCFCEERWTGESCAERKGAEGDSEKECPTGHNNEPCSSNGRCVDGECVCDDGWYGKDCASAVVVGKCPNRCSGHGVCSDGECECIPGYTGEDCSRQSTSHMDAMEEQCGDCGEHGHCGEDGTCHCDENWGGSSCKDPLCPNACSDNGFCTDGHCVCEPGFAGKDCSAKCPNKCSGHGSCDVKPGEDEVKAHCFCSPGWGGNDCSDVMTKREGMKMNSLLAVALGTFVVGLCAIPLVRTVQAQRALKERRHIIYGPQGMSPSDATDPLTSGMHVSTA